MNDAPARFVAVDDDEDHLRAIVDTFQREGIACLGVRYRAEAPLDPTHFRGVRALFLDLHLVASGSFGNRQHFGVLAQNLNEVISPEGGPFVLIIWTQHDDQVDALIDYLDETEDLSDYARPVAIARLAKDKFLNPDDRTVRSHGDLTRAIDQAVDIAPQLNALFSWEQDVRAAAGSTLAALVDLVPSDQRTSGHFRGELDIVLSRLAIAAVGKDNVGTDPRAALSASLAPILADRIVSQTSSTDEDLWRKAITHTSVPDLPSDAAGKVNRMLHIALPPSEKILPTDWGAVVEFPVECPDQSVLPQFGITLSDLLSEELKVKHQFHGVCRLRLVRIGAPCDYAQNNSGPLTYVLAVEVPEEATPQKTLPVAVWRSPWLSVDGPTAYRLFVHSRFPWTIPTDGAASWTVKYRLREHLLMQLIYTAGTYSTRPGYISLP